MKKKYVEVETTMSELILLALETEEGKKAFKKFAVGDWEEELASYRQELEENLKKPKEEEKIIITARSKD